MEEKTKKEYIATLQMLRNLYDVRFFMQTYAKGKMTENLRENLLSAYALLADTPEIRKAAVDLIKSQVEEAEFNPLSYKRTMAKEDKQAQKLLQKNKEQNKTVYLLCRQLKEELEHQQKQGKLTDISTDARPLKVWLENNAGKESFMVAFEGVNEPVAFKVRTYKNKHFSLLGAATFNKENFGKVGLNQKSYAAIAETEDKTLELVYADDAGNRGKKYSVVAYKKFLGMNIKDILPQKYEKELEILNSLPVEDQQKFLEGVKKRKQKQQDNLAFFKALDEYPDAVKLLSQSGKLKRLFKTGNMKVDEKVLQDYFINNVVKEDKNNVWSKFTQNAEAKERFSRYDVLISSVLHNYLQDFNKVLDINSFDTAKNELKFVFNKIKESVIPRLPNQLCAEITALGIFRAATGKSVNETKLSNMNKLLNEFGINVSFKKLKVDRIPPDNIETAEQQMKISRMEFEKSKSRIYKLYGRKLQDMMSGCGITEPDNDDLHHYIALKYAAFLSRELNDTPNLVKTIRQHPWNTDGHKLTHLFDTSGDFLISDNDNSYYLMNFNTLRKAYKQNNELTINAPILQVKKDGRFVDLLALKTDGLSGMGYYVSSDKTEQNYIKVPKFCAEIDDENMKKTNLLNR